MAYWVCSYGVVNCPICRRSGISNAEKRRLCLQSYNEKVALDNRVWLIVPFSQKGQVKKLGARWDANVRKWYADGTQNTSRFAQWKMTATPTVAPVETVTRVETFEPIDVFASDEFDRQELEKMGDQGPAILPEIPRVEYTEEEMCALSAKFQKELAEREKAYAKVFA